MSILNLAALQASSKKSKQSALDRRIAEQELRLRQFQQSTGIGLKPLERLLGNDRARAMLQAALSAKRSAPKKKASPPAAPKPQAVVRRRPSIQMMDEDELLQRELHRLAESPFDGMKQLTMTPVERFLAKARKAKEDARIMAILASRDHRPSLEDIEAGPAFSGSDYEGEMPLGILGGGKVQYDSKGKPIPQVQRSLGFRPRPESEAQQLFTEYGRYPTAEEIAAHKAWEAHNLKRDPGRLIRTGPAGYFSFLAKAAPHAFVHVATAGDEELEKRAEPYVDMAGNLVPVLGTAKEAGELAASLAEGDSEGFAHHLASALISHQVGEFIKNPKAYAKELKELNERYWSKETPNFDRALNRMNGADPEMESWVRAQKTFYKTPGDPVGYGHEDWYKPEFIRKMEAKVAKSKKRGPLRVGGLLKPRH